MEKPSRSYSNNVDTRITLLERIARRAPLDEHAWQEFVDQYSPMIYRWCRRWGLQDADAKDVTQQVLASLPSKIAAFKYDPSGSFRAWLRTIAHHAWSDFVGRSRRQRAASGSLDVGGIIGSIDARSDLGQRLKAEFDLELLEQAVKRVRERVEPTTWEAYRLTAWDEVPAAEVAARLEKKIATIYVARSKVQRMLREEIHDLLGS